MEQNIIELKNILKKGFDISSFMGYKQEKVIVTFQKKKDVLKKEFIFSNRRYYLIFLSAVRRYYDGSGRIN